MIFAEKDITQINDKLDQNFDDFAPSILMVKEWFTEFRSDRTRRSDAERSGRSIDLATTEASEKTHDIVLTDRRFWKFAKS